MGGAMEEVQHVRTFLQDLALVFCVAALVTLVFQRLRQPVVLGYLLAGIILGPHVPIPLFADHQRIETLSELGVILVMFSIGLEFSFARIRRVLPTAGLAGAVQITAMFWIGYLVGRLFGLSGGAAVFVGGMVCISSTMIVARAFADHPVEERLSELVFSVLIVQDLAAILLITVLTAVASGAGLPPAEMARTAGELFLFLVGAVVIGLLVVPRLIREAHHRLVSETLLVTTVGVCFGLALLAQYLGYSVALGAFLAGSLVAESGRRRNVEHLIAPLRDLFAAVFFVSIGMLVDPGAILDQAGLVATLVAIVVFGQSTFIALGTFLTGAGVNLSVRAGMSLAQIGEFSFIIVGVGVARGVVSTGLMSVAVGVAVITTFLTPFLVRLSGRAALMVEARLPRPLQTFAALYGSWFEAMRARRESRERSAMARRWLRLAGDGVILAGIVLATALGHRAATVWLEAQLGIGERAAYAVVITGAVVAALPFLYGVGRSARQLGLALGQRALPGSDAGLDLAAAPRRAFVIALQVGLMLLVAFPVVALSQPFLPLYWGAAILATLLLAFGVAFWRGATNLEGHVRAGAQLVLEALERQRRPDPAAAPVDLVELLPGLGGLEPVLLPDDSPAVGKTLAQLELRGRTGATVLAIRRAAGDTVAAPSGAEVLGSGDVLSVTGSREAIAAATSLLLSGPSGSEAAARSDGSAIRDRPDE
jgi:monovalent cation:H+ antiporter-2, CPA2 family